MPFHNFINAHARLFVLLVQMSLKSISGIDGKSTIFTIINVIEMFGFDMTSKVFSAASMLTTAFAPISPHVVSSNVVFHCLQWISSFVFFLYICEKE